MSGAVLRGDWVRVRRIGDRVRIRTRPAELIWRTTHAFTVAEVREIEIEPVWVERRRRGRHRLRAGSGISQPAITRVRFEYGSAEPAVVELHESDEAVRAVFADLGDRVLAPGHPATDASLVAGADGVQDASSVADGSSVADAFSVADASSVADDVPSEPEGLPPISWRAEPEPVIDLVAEEERAHARLAEDPDDIELWLRGPLRMPVLQSSAAMTIDDWLGVTEPPRADPATGDAAWVVKRPRRGLLGRHHRTIR